MGGIENYGLVSIAIFFACFLGMVAWALRLKKPFLTAMAAKPLEPDLNDTQPDDTRHE
jgi:cbb3-type cytochrome oxidase subunit 3